MRNFRSDLEQYLRFEVSLSELRTRLGSSWQFEREGHNFALSGDVILDVPVEIDFEHVTNAVNLVLQDKIPACAIEEWANLLLLSDAYAIGSHRDESERETLLQCIHELATPSAFGELDTEHLLKVRRWFQSNGRS